jgi:hypothetical protein
VINRPAIAARLSTDGKTWRQAENASFCIGGMPLSAMGSQTRNLLTAAAGHAGLFSMAMMWLSMNRDFFM